MAFALGYEGTEVSIVKRFIKPGDTVLDIVTNIGFYSLLMISLVGANGCVVGFEPLRYLREKARRSISENNLSEFCEVYNPAVTN